MKDRFSLLLKNHFLASYHPTQLSSPSAHVVQHLSHLTSVHLTHTLRVPLGIPRTCAYIQASHSFHLSANTSFIETLRKTNLATFPRIYIQNASSATSLSRRLQFLLSSSSPEPFPLSSTVIFSAYRRLPLRCPIHFIPPSPRSRSQHRIARFGRFRSRCQNWFLTG